LPRSNIGLHAGVIELGAALDPRAAHVDGDALSTAIDIDRPQQCRAQLPRQQRGRVFRQGLGMQWNLGVGAVQGFSTPVRLEVDRVAGTDERRDIGDRVMHAETVAVALDEHRLVEVHRIGRIDGDERDVGTVLVRQSRMGGRGDGGLFDLGREGRRQSEFAADIGHAARQDRILVRVQAQAPGRRHGRFPDRVMPRF
jgi:hypothetical protein